MPLQGQPFQAQETSSLLNVEAFFSRHFSTKGYN